MKEGGKRGGEKEKCKWEDAREFAKRGRLDDIDAKIFCSHYTALKNIAKDNMERMADLDTKEPIGLWYYGDTGTGKTCAAIKEFPGAYRKIANNKWWDGYQDEEYVIMDDLDVKHDYMGYHLKIWADRYAFMAEIKGSARYIRFKKIVVTSNVHPSQIWQDDATLLPILRRFKIVHFIRPFDKPSLYQVSETRPAYDPAQDEIVHLDALDALNDSFHDFLKDF